MRIILEQTTFGASDDTATYRPAEFHTSNAGTYVAEVDVFLLDGAGRKFRPPELRIVVESAQRRQCTAALLRMAAEALPTADLQHL